MEHSFLHKTVLLDEAVELMALKPDGIYVDATFGRGGHSKRILACLNESGRLYAIDRDPEAIAVAKEMDDPRFEIIPGPFSGLLQYMEERDLLAKVDGILLDLGVSSPQLDDAQRGFSFMREGPLDMRMDPSSGQSAAQWLNHADASDIAWVLKTFGEERFAKRIASAIVEYRNEKPLETTSELAKLIDSAQPFKEKAKHPATRSFQAIRIFINSELDEIEQVLNASLKVLAKGGRLSVISFHSLEDRMVKRFIKKQSQGEEAPFGLPLTESQLNKSKTLKAIGKARKPQAEEVKANPRARSSVLRIAERLGE